MKRIEESFLSKGNLFLAKWEQGFTLHLVESVKEVFLREYDEVFKLIDSGDNLGQTRILDQREQDYLFLDDELGASFLHGSLGIAPELMRLYWSIPEEGGNIFDFPNIEPASSSKGSDYGYLNGLTNPIDEPSNFMSVAIPPNLHPSIDIYNPYDDPKKPTISLRFANYDTLPVDVKGMEKKLASLFDPKIDKEVILPMGDPSNPQKYTENLQKKFKVRPLSRKELGNVLRGKEAPSVKVEGA